MKKFLKQDPELDPKSLDKFIKFADVKIRNYQRFLLLFGSPAAYEEKGILIELLFGRGLTLPDSRFESVEVFLIYKKLNSCNIQTENIFLKNNIYGSI